MAECYFQDGMQTWVDRDSSMTLPVHSVRDGKSLVKATDTCKCFLTYFSTGVLVVTMNSCIKRRPALCMWNKSMNDSSLQLTKEKQGFIPSYFLAESSSTVKEYAATS